MSEEYRKISTEFQKEQINRILDLESNVQIQNASLIFNNSSNDLEDMTKEDFFELNNLECRKIDYSNSSSDSNLPKLLYGNKDIIYYDLKEDDTLPKLSLEFACKVSEIKHANKIYNDKELHALRKIKIPVVKGGSIYEKYMKGEQNGSSTSLLLIDFEKSENVTENNFEEDRKNIFKVQTSHEINPGFDYLQCEGDDEDDFDIFNKKEFENQSSLLDSMQINLDKHIANNEPTIDDFISKVDDQILKEKQNIESLNDDATAGTSVMFPSEQRQKTEEYGTACYLSWKFYLAIVILIAVIAPILYFVHFHKN